MKKEKKVMEDEISREMTRTKDLLSLREKEIETMKQDLRRLTTMNEELKA